MENKHSGSFPLYFFENYGFENPSPKIDGFDRTHAKNRLMEVIYYIPSTTLHMKLPKTTLHAHPPSGSPSFVSVSFVGLISLCCSFVSVKVSFLVSVPSGCLFIDFSSDCLPIASRL